MSTPSRTDSDRAANAKAVAAHRARTNNTYQRLYNKAVRLATQRLRDRHPDEYGEMLNTSRREVGL